MANQNIPREDAEEFKKITGAYPVGYDPNQAQSDSLAMAQKQYNLLNSKAIYDERQTPKTPKFDFNSSASRIDAGMGGTIDSATVFKATGIPSLEPGQMKRERLAKEEIQAEKDDLAKKDVLLQNIEKYSTPIANKDGTPVNPNLLAVNEKQLKFYQKQLDEVEARQSKRVIKRYGGQKVIEDYAERMFLSQVNQKIPQAIALENTIKALEELGISRNALSELMGKDMKTAVKVNN